MVVEMLLQYAEELGVGTDLPLEHIPPDPLDPYDLDRDADTAGLPQRADL